MDTKTVYVKELSYVIARSSLEKALLLTYTSGVKNGMAIADGYGDIVPSEQILKEAFEILIGGMTAVK